MSSFLEPKKVSETPRKSAGEGHAPDAIPVDGFAQVVSLLQVADASVRESLLSRIAAKDPVLARQIRMALINQ
jgi:hypothetical protein